MNTVSQGKIDILLVDDNEIDVKFLRRAFARFGDLNRLNVVGDGIQALQYLRREAGFCEALAPDLILLDLNMPRKNGLEVLDEIKSDVVLGHIPVIILTTSSDERTILKTYKLRANSYITKPVTFEDFTRVASLVTQYWSSIVKLPGCSESRAPKGS